LVNRGSSEEAHIVAEPTTSRVLTLMAEKSLGILGLFFALSYALSRPAYDSFYSALGLQPEDIGLTQVGMISHGATFLILLLLFVSIAIVGGIAIALLLRHRSIIIQAPAFLLLLALSILSTLHRDSLSFSVWDAVLLVLGEVALTAILCMMFFLANGPRAFFRMWRGFFRSAPKAGPLLSLTAVILFGLFLLLSIEYSGAYWAGDRLMATGKVSGAWDVLLNIRATPVEVAVIGKDLLTICDGSQKAYLLGRTENANYVLLISQSPPYRGSRAVRLPSDNYEVISHGRLGAAPCGQFPVPTSHSSARRQGG
jgi:hypothetical protein